MRSKEKKEVVLACFGLFSRLLRLFSLFDFVVVVDMSLSTLHTFPFVPIQPRSDFESEIAKWGPRFRNSSGKLSRLIRERLTERRGYTVVCNGGKASDKV